MGNIFERSDFDPAVDAAFPKARRTRKEHGNGWEDTFRMGLLEVSIRVYNGQGVRRRAEKPVRGGTVVAIINGVRTSIDGSVTPLWRRQASEFEGLEKVLAELRAELLGMAHAITVISGRKKKPAIIEALAPALAPMGKNETELMDMMVPPKSKPTSVEELITLWESKPDVTKS